MARKIKVNIWRFKETDANQIMIFFIYEAKINKSQWGISLRTEKKPGLLKTPKADIR